MNIFFILCQYIQFFLGFNFFAYPSRQGDERKPKKNENPSPGGSLGNRGGR